MHSAPLSLPDSGPGRIPLRVRVSRAALAAGALGLAVALLYANAVPCLFARVFRTPCPGCGSSRAVVALLHGDVASVVQHNPLAPVMALLLGALGAQALASVFFHGDLREVGAGRVGVIVKRGVVAVVALEVLVWVARFFGFLGGPVAV